VSPSRIELYLAGLIYGAAPVATLWWALAPHHSPLLSWLAPVACGLVWFATAVLTVGVLAEWRMQR
jgi:hypothetical protein